MTLGVGFRGAFPERGERHECFGGSLALSFERHVSPDEKEHGARDDQKYGNVLPGHREF
jgi:hypothetical protein